jgi:hypothetical protein
LLDPADDNPDAISINPEQSVLNAGYPSFQDYTVQQTATHVLEVCRKLRKPQL